MKYFNYFDACYVINLDKRVDRYNNFLNRTKDIFSCERFSGIIHDEEYNDIYKKYKIGCTLSHLAIYRLAKSNGYKNTLIFEDDCCFVDNFKDIVHDYIEQLKNIKWDLFYLGGEINNSCHKVSNNLFRVTNGGVYNTHAYAINNTFYEKALSINYNHIETIDLGLLNYDYTQRDYIVTDRLLCWQDGGVSDLRGYVSSTRTILENSYNKYIPK